MFPFDKPDLVSKTGSLERVLDSVGKAVAEAFSKPDPHHGVDHALQVERNIAGILKQPDVAVTKEQGLLVRIAGLLHDVGYGAYVTEWSPDRREHVQASLQFAESQLAKSAAFSNDTNPLLSVLFLIAHHDDTNYMFPSLITDGVALLPDIGVYQDLLTKFVAGLSRQQYDLLEHLLMILREADAMAATGVRGAQRTLEYSEKRGLPLFSNGNPLNAWAWEESVVGNVRLAAKRLMIDCVSHKGQRLARQQYDQAERLVMTLCSENLIPYHAESLNDKPLAYDEPPHFRLHRYQTWNQLERILRCVCLREETNLKPYMTAVIALRLISLSDLRPTSYYVLDSGMVQAGRLLDALHKRYQLGLFDLTGMIEYEFNSEQVLMSPPIVETYYEPVERAMVMVIVDGLHRLLLAKELGIERVWVVEIRNIPEEFPLVPLPLQWHDVVRRQSVPVKKRKLRFSSLETFPDVSYLTNVAITPENYEYFFYRNLSPLGSSGPRE